MIRRMWAFRPHPAELAGILLTLAAIWLLTDRPRLVLLTAALTAVLIVVAMNYRTRR